MILAMCQQHPRHIQRERHTQRQIQRQERTSRKRVHVYALLTSYILYIRVGLTAPSSSSKVLPVVFLFLLVQKVRKHLSLSISD